jgi:translation initiation factor IF-2
MELQIINEKDLAPIKDETKNIFDQAKSLTIKTEDDLIVAADNLKKIKLVAANVKALKEKFTKPANEILKMARTMFAPFESVCDEAEAEVKRKMLIFNQAQEKKAEKKTETIMKNVAEGKVSVEKAAEKIEAVAPKTSVQGNVGAIQYRTIKKVVIENPALLPREYLVPNEVMIRKAALAGVQIAGVKVVEEKQVASY